MAKPSNITVSESLDVLKEAKKKQIPAKHKRVEMLVLIKKGTHLTVGDLGTALGVAQSTIQTWRGNYKKGGLALLLEDGRGGKRPAQITAEAHKVLGERLSSPTGAFRSFGEARDWINSEFGLDMGYHAVNKYIKRHFGAKLKVARRSHVDKDPAAPAVFKKPFTGA